MTERIYGYLTDSVQTDPVYDPGLGASCSAWSEKDDQ